MLQKLRQRSQRGVLGVFVGDVIGPFQFDTEGEIIAVFPPLKRGDAGMPGSPIARHKL